MYLEHPSKAVDEIPVPDSTVSISSVLEVAVNLLCVFRVQEKKKKKQTANPLHFEATSLCLWHRLTVGVVRLWDG